MKLTLKFAAALFAFFLATIPARTLAAILPIQPIAQQTPEWCFAASATMIFQHFGYPNLNQAGNFQCGVVAAQGGPCMINCFACPTAGGTMQRVGMIMQSYAMIAQQTTGYFNSSVHMQMFGILSPAQIAGQIDNGAPIMAGISPGQIPYPPGLGVSQHAVVIVGYETNGTAFNVVINDPYPYPGVAPYVQAGGMQLQPGQYAVPYPIFVGVFHYGNSLTFR
jgi:hypothetical protein